MLNGEQRSVLMQGKMIDDLRAQVAQAKHYQRSAERRMETMREKADTFEALIDQIADNPTLQSEWDRFVTIVKLANPDFYIKYKHML